MAVEKILMLTGTTRFSFVCFCFCFFFFRFFFLFLFFVFVCFVLFFSLLATPDKILA